jgi:hypothetical protein
MLDAMAFRAFALDEALAAHEALDREHTPEPTVLGVADAVPDLVHHS